MDTADLDVSPTSETDTASPALADPAPAPPDTGDNAASPPDAPKDDGPKSLLDAVMKAVEPAKTSPESEADKPSEPSPATDPNAKPTTTPDPSLDADPSADELKAYVPRTRQRIERLLSERNAARTEADGAKTDAARWQQMDSYLTQHDLAAEDVNLLLGIGAALRRGDFKAFRDGVMPYVELANQALGLSVTPDLQAKIDSGEMTEAAAKELSQARLTTSRLQSTVEANQQQQRQHQQAQAAESHRAGIESAVEQWEAGVKVSDPDYSAKAPFVREVSLALIGQYGPPKSAADAVEYAKRAHARAGELLAQTRPRPVPTRPAPNSASSVTGGRAVPSSMLEAVELGLERSRRRG